jgi:two-component system chemotaxis response regulator CheB
MIKVLVVDDSAVVRKVLTEKLQVFPDIEVIGTAMDPYVAREKIAIARPDVITLDLEMPRMDGLQFLEALMAHYPIPVVVVSSLAPENSENALRALELGAVDIVQKPGASYSPPDVAALARTIRAAATARPKARPAKNSQQETSLRSTTLLRTTHKVLAIGASTGGPQALDVLMSQLPATTPGTIIVQHMPAGFTASFAHRLDQGCAMSVREARDGDSLVPGVALVAPGNRHILVKRSGATYFVNLKDGPAVHYQRPAIDVTFMSVAKGAGPDAVGVILTGMGVDGAAGLMEMKNAGAHTIAQDEASSVVFGMPKEAILLGAVDRVLTLDAIPKAIVERFR